MNSNEIKLLSKYPIYSVHSPLTEKADLNISDIYSLEKYLLLEKFLN